MLVDKRIYLASQSSRRRELLKQIGVAYDVLPLRAGLWTLRQYLDRPAISGDDDRGGAMGLLAAMEMHELH